MAFMQSSERGNANIFFNQDLKVLLVNSNIAELVDAMETFQAVSFPTSQLIKKDSCNSALALLKENLQTEDINPYRIIMVDRTTLQ